MSLARTLHLDRISGQMAILILASLLAIHAVITASIFINHRGDGGAPRDDSAEQFVTSVKLISAALPADRARILGTIARSFPQLGLARVGEFPGGPAPDGDQRLRRLAHGLGIGFRLALLGEVHLPGGSEGFAVAVQMPDGTALTARLAQPPWPPVFGGPLSTAILFVVISITLLGLWAARTLRTPLSEFAKAAEGFSLEGDAAELPERGPEEIRAVAQAFNRMRERIRALVDERTRMLAALGHDLRTPITRLRLRSEFIADQDLRAQMLRDLEQMNAMTEDALTFLRGGQTRENATAVDIASSLQTICDQFADMGHQVAYRGPDHLTIRARPIVLQRAVTNLVDNAVRHGSHVELRLAATPGAAMIEVQDDGPGIADADKERMQQPFVRGDAARGMDESSGFGLGLAVSRAAIESHGGTFVLLDGVPTGLIVRITLPAATSLH